MAQGFEKMKGLYSFTPKPETAPDTDAWIARYKNIQTLQADVAKDVLERYQLLMDQIGEEQMLKDSIEGRLGRIYIELESGTRLLEPYKKVARDVCNSQTSNEKGA
jgi:hypothetical protein